MNLKKFQIKKRNKYKIYNNNLRNYNMTIISNIQKINKMIKRLKISMIKIQKN